MAIQCDITIQCDIVSAHEEIFSGEVAMFVATGTAGELGITPRHAPLMTTLKPGQLRVLLPDGDVMVYFVGGGILEVMPHLITVAADTVVRADELDEAAAAKAKEEAERELADRTGELEIAKAQAKLAEALAQLQALERLRKKVKHP
jgi:F-type H+-transporting ATPase subunit epsilon